jgi:hypothetical protein
MNSDPENFESLRRLLAWKRHEQPPPGYFNDFSRRVIARIEAGEQGTDRAGWSTWLLRVWLALQARPAFAGAFGAAVCAFLVVGMVGSEEAPIVSYRPDSAPNQVVLGTGAHLGSAADAPGALPPLLDRTNSQGTLAELFNQSLVVAEPAKANTSLMGGH